ncbi:MAG: type II secretion system F family protein [Thermoguttaceae bacterium]
MTSIIIIAGITFLGVTLIVLGLSLLMRNKPLNRIEDRLGLLTGKINPAAKEILLKDSVLAHPLDDSPGIFERFVQHFGDVNKIFEQADTSLTVMKLLLISMGMALVGGVLAFAIRIVPLLVPLVALIMGVLPLMWVLFRRKKRLKHFAAQLPEAMEMIARTLRSGQSLGFGISLVATEMGQPIAGEFNRVFEEQNLGLPMEQSLKELADRIPNLDLKFFVTAVILQRQTGGDLAEILDKIGSLVRDRFRIWGQVQALTGEGRLSGVVLLVLPLVLFLAVYQLNPDYIKVLFTDPMGTKMLAIAVVMQIIGALVIRKIVNIRV